MTHPQFKRCEKCLEEIHVIEGVEWGHEYPCEANIVVEAGHFRGEQRKVIPMTKQE